MADTNLENWIESYNLSLETKSAQLLHWYIMEIDLIEIKPLKPQKPK